MNIHVTNLNQSVKDNDLETLFAPFGQVVSAKVAMDVFTGQSRGFGLVEMTDEEAARAAIDRLNSSEFNGNVLTVKEEETKRIQTGSYKVGNGPVNIFKYRKK
jgi:RNA recognition motif-containing protein